MTQQGFGFGRFIPQAIDNLTRLFMEAAQQLGDMLISIFEGGMEKLTGGAKMLGGLLSNSNSEGIFGSTSISTGIGGDSFSPSLGRTMESAPSINYGKILSDGGVSLRSAASDFSRVSAGPSGFVPSASPAVFMPSSPALSF